jgi:GntR family transcriptional regulator, sialic acid-inducible nan operon repressor
MRQIDGIARLLLSSSPDHLQHLKEARRFFEMGMVRMAAEHAQASDIAELRALVDAQREKLGDVEAFIAVDIAFHRRIAALSGNPIFAAVSDALLNWLFTYHTDVLLWQGGEHRTLSEHAVIVDRLATKDGEGAAAAMAVHLDRSETLYKFPG